MTSVLFGFTQDLIFGLGGFSILFGLKTKCFSFGKFHLKNLLNNPMAFGMILSPFSKSLLPWHEWKSPPKSLSPSLCQVILQIQQVEPPHDFSSIYFLSKIISAFQLLEIYKGTTFSPLSFFSKPFSLASPQGPQPRSMMIHWSPVQKFQIVLAASLDHICQI